MTVNGTTTDHSHQLRIFRKCLQSADTTPSHLKSPLSSWWGYRGQVECGKPGLVDWVERVEAVAWDAFQEGAAKVRLLRP